VSFSDDTLPASGPTIQRAFELLVATLNQHGIRYAIIGGLATVQYTRVRTTDDIDALVIVPQITMPGLFESLVSAGFTVDPVTAIQQLRNEGLTTFRYSDVIIDLLRPIIPAYAHVLDRAVDAPVMGQTVRISSPEGLIVMKLIAMRPQDQSDVRELLDVYRGKLDLDFIRSELETFSDAGDERRTMFEAWVRERNR
jgi:predicted nucleotidyltransferase